MPTFVLLLNFAGATPIVFPLPVCGPVRFPCMLNVSFLLRALCGALMMALLLACAGPLDRKLDTGKGSDAYFATLNPAFEKMSEREQQAFNWAVSDLDLDAVHARYANASPRQIIRGEVAAVLKNYPPRIAELQPAAQAAEQMRKQLDAIKVTHSSFKLEASDFGLMPKVSLTIENGSELPLSEIKWQLFLHLDGADTPVADYTVTSNFEREGGLQPGQRSSSHHEIGFVRGEPSWTTLEVRNARQHQVWTSLQYGSALDFGNRSYLGEDPSPRIERLGATLKTAEGYQDI